MIIVFAGAGASKAVRADRYPTTIEFFTGLPDDIRNDPLFDHAVQYLKERAKKDTVLDIEQVLWILNELVEFTQKASDRNSVPGWFFEDNRITTATHQHGDMREIMNIAFQAKAITHNLLSKINSRVYELYGESPERGDLTNNWILLLTELTQLIPRVELVTTNYDLVIEEAIDASGVRIQTGRTPGTRRILDQRVWDLGPRISSELYLGALTKLHGSVDWIRGNQPNRIDIGDPSFHGQHERHAIIYPGFKGTPIEPPFQNLHTYFEAQIRKAQILIFVGYAFRDEYINDTLSRYLSGTASVIVLNPRLPKVPFSKSRYKHVEKPFDRVGVLETLAEVKKILNKQKAASQ